MSAHIKIVLGLIAFAFALAAMALAVRVRLGDDALTLPAPLAIVGGTRDEGDPTLRVLAEAMPPFRNIAAWLNADALTAESLRGKVTLIDFWTYSCINCIRTMPYVTAWHEKYKDEGFTVVGVHTPEFAFEKEEKNVRAAIARHGITYPVALDNDFGTWDAYGNRYWPAHYLFDTQGRLRYVHFGEGKYDETEAAIRALIAEAGVASTEGVTTFDSTVEFSKIASRETYVGYARQEGFESPESLRKDAVQTYSIPEKPRKNRFSLGGMWKVEEERAVLASDGGSIAYRYDASNANLVMGSSAPVRAEVTLDGVPVPEALRGADVFEENGRTFVHIDEDNLYSLTDGRGVYGEHVLRLDFEDAGVECYAFTFG